MREIHPVAGRPDSRPDDDLAGLSAGAFAYRDGDVVVVTSTVDASKGRAHEIALLHPDASAVRLRHLLQALTGRRLAVGAGRPARRAGPHPDRDPLDVVLLR